MIFRQSDYSLVGIQLLYTHRTTSVISRTCRKIQLAINNTRNQSIGKPSSQLLLGYIPQRVDDMWLRDKVPMTCRLTEDIVAARKGATREIEKAQNVQKNHFDRR